MKYRYDLHCHSSNSDGCRTVSELIALAKRRGMSGLVVKDHYGCSILYHSQNECKLLYATDNHAADVGKHYTGTEMRFRSADDIDRRLKTDTLQQRHKTC